MRGLLLLLCFLGGCATTVQKASLAPAPQPKAPEIAMSVSPQEVKPKARNTITDDVMVFRNLQMFDLNGDGKKEMVAVYTTKTHTSGVKVMNLGDGKTNIIYAHIFNTPNARLNVINGMPEIISEEFDPFSGLRLKKTYRWDGKGFTSGEKQPNVLAVTR